ncbi:sugar transporter (plasmid) [Tritonibacter scottomollicae]|uniref:Sugar transporter n=1 Tax=Tritonibacter scottomollicae TaxID=483013 RepID=A0ABZ0HME5_TRISK|nr:sugar transporter [Tritonibacter scottomollicae]WOI35325.1 sugar transporter [Tritonibacter scottomollicae]
MTQNAVKPESDVSKDSQKNTGAKKPEQSKAAAPQSAKAKAPPAGSQAGAAAPRVVEVPPMANKAKPRKRHYGILASFALVVLVPTLAAFIYMYQFALDQYESRVGFVVRTEESQSALDMLSGITGVSSASSSDTDILYEFIQSQEMVQRVDEKVDLRQMFSRPGQDPVFTLHSDASLEELVQHWPERVRVFYDGSTGLIEVRIYAFTAQDAHELAELIYGEASRMINALSDVARADATTYAAEERDKAIKRLVAARQTMTAFRIRTQIVDPTADIAGQMGLLNTLQTQLAEVLIDQDLMKQTARESDPRLEQLQKRIDVIEARITAERRKLGVGSRENVAGDGESFATLIGEYERLKVDVEFAERAYLSALSAYDAAVSEAQRTSRYLAAYLQPTLAETSTAPGRSLVVLLIGGFALMLWFIGVLIYYSFRDRR